MTVRQIEGELRTVVDVLRAAAEANGDLEAYVEPATGSTARRALTFGQWDRAADGVAGLFASLGVTRGSVVCLVLPSSFDYMVCYAAATRLGAITSGVNPRLGSREVASILERTLPAVTVVDDGAPVPGGPTGTALRRAEVVEAFDGAPPDRWPDLEPEDPVAVVWTSGTTGLPKGAVFDHRSLAAVATGSDTLSEPGDRRLSPLPFAHVGSMTRLWDEVLHGVTTVITPTPWRATDAIRVMEEERITVAQGVPTQWALVMAHPDLATADLSELRVAGTGASRVPAELVAAMRDRLGVPVVVRYTSTEASLGTGTVPGDADEVVAVTVGRPMPGVELLVADDRGDPVPTGEVGRVRLRSAAVMRGYWG
ncbi:MAG: class I adenylate-forming enzyme family protein, partial [Acidimicrobiales bacterium]